MDFLIRKSLISSLLALFVSGCTALLAQKTVPAEKSTSVKSGDVKSGQNQVAKANGDATLPAYYFSYASAGIFRNEANRTGNLAKQQNLLVSVPVLASTDLTVDQSKALFKQSIMFQLAGYDSETQFASESGKGNVPLSESVTQLISKDDSGIDQLYDIQVQQGNVLVVDSETKFPLMIQGGTYAPEFDFNDEIAEYHSTIYYWAAAYPWLFYELKNYALRQTLLEKDLRLLGFFARERFYLDDFTYQAILASESPLENKFN